MDCTEEWGLERRRADLSQGETPSYMAEQASREALQHAELAPEALDLIINASGIPEQAIPDGVRYCNDDLDLAHLGLQQ